MARRNATALMHKSGTVCVHCDLSVEQVDIPANHPGRGTRTWVHTKTQNVWCQLHLLSAGLSAAFAEPR